MSVEQIRMSALLKVGLALLCAVSLYPGGGSAGEVPKVQAHGRGSSIQYVSGDIVREIYDGDLTATIKGFTVSESQNNMLIVAVGWGVFDQPSKVEALSRGGRPFKTARSCLEQNLERNLGLQLFWMDRPQAGADDIVVRLADPGQGKIDEISMAAIEIKSVDLTTPISGCASSLTFDSETIEAHVASEPGDLAIDALYFLSERQAPVPDQRQTQRLNNAAPSVSIAMSTATAEGPWTSMRWSGVKPGVAILVGVNVKPKPTE